MSSSSIPTKSPVPCFLFFSKNIQQPLSDAQARPVIGLAVSVIKLAISLIQMVGGLIASIITSPLLCTDNNSKPFNYAMAALLHAGFGMYETYNALGNIFTLGRCSDKFIYDYYDS